MITSLSMTFRVRSTLLTFLSWRAKRGHLINKSIEFSFNEIAQPVPSKAKESSEFLAMTTVKRGKVYTFNFLSFVLGKEEINDFSQMNDF